MEIIKNAELVEVAYENENKKAVLTFLDKDAGEIREVTFNKQVYKDGKFVDDAEKAAKVDEWCKDFFDTDFDSLTDCIGECRDIYAYPKFSSLYEVEMVEKFDDKMKGNIYQTAIKEVLVDELFIKIRYEIAGKLYESKMSCCKFVDAMGKYYPDPVRREKEYAKFEEKFGVPVERADEIIGKKLIVEVKSAFGKYNYGELKKMPD